MADVATDILNAVKAALETEYPGESVKLRRASDKHPLYTPGDPVPGYVVTNNENIKRTGATATQVFKEFSVTVSYLSREIPGTKTDDPVIRQFQEDMERLFDIAGWDAVPEVSQCDPASQRPYTLPTPDKTLNVASVILAFETLESRN